MARITIFEDSISSVLSRYKHLIPNHEVKVYFVNGVDEYLHEGNQAELQDLGFSVETLWKYQIAKEDDGGIPQIDPRHFTHIVPMDEDLYFVDGMKHLFWSVLTHLPRDRSYLCTGNPNMASNARDSGYQTIDSYHLREGIDQLLIEK